MRVNLDILESMAENETAAERKMAQDMRENRDLYKTSFRIAMKVKRSLRVKGMTQAQLAEAMDVDCAVISRYLSGKANLELKTIVKIEKALGINIIDREITPKKPKVIVLKDFFNTTTKITDSFAVRNNSSKGKSAVNEYCVDSNYDPKEWTLADPIAEYIK